MKYILNNLFSLAILFLSSTNLQAQNAENWTSKQLIEPSDLAITLQTKKSAAIILSIGPAATIPNSIDIGMVNNKPGVDKLKDQLKVLSRDKKIVIYCGCCPFEHCPNIRPAINVLKEMKFTNFYLLNLTHNIKKDWIDKGYPVVK